MTAPTISRTVLDQDEDGAGPTLLEGESLRTPPLPFAQAPALRVPQG